MKVANSVDMGVAVVQVMVACKQQHVIGSKNSVQSVVCSGMQWFLSSDVHVSMHCLVVGQRLC